MESAVAATNLPDRGPLFQFGHGGEPWSHPVINEYIGSPQLSFNSATAVSRGVTFMVFSLNDTGYPFQFGHGGEPWSLRMEKGDHRFEIPVSIRPRR